MVAVKRAVAALSTTALLVVGIASPAAAAQQQQSGLVNVAVGDVTVQDVNVGVAANVVAAVCGVAVGPVALLATQVNRTGLAQSATCPATGGNYTFTQA
jgi:hypothetical protein